MTNTTSGQFRYQPGICNIDDPGARWRKKLGYINFLAGIIALVLSYAFHVHVILRFIIGASAGFTTSLNFLQAHEHFCVMNGAQRTFETSLHRTKITNDLYKDVDRKKMLNMIGRSLIYALIGGSAGLLPL
jgi:hypothetical protein